MHTYLIDTEYAAKALIEIIYHEEKKYLEISTKYQNLKKHFDILNLDFSTSDLSEDFTEHQVIDKFIRMSKFYEDNDLKGKEIELSRTHESLKNKKHSIDALSMSLLQIAKQGISTVRGKLENCPSGRIIGSESLSNIIWQGRNQSIHYEEGYPYDSVQKCFLNLSKDFDSDFDITSDPKINKAKMVIDILCWTNYENYKNDMISLID